MFFRVLKGDWVDREALIFCQTALLWLLLSLLRSKECPVLAVFPRYCALPARVFTPEDVQSKHK